MPSRELAQGLCCFDLTHADPANRTEQQINECLQTFSIA